MSEQRKLQCVFYSHPWAIHLLRHAGMGTFDNSVLVELAGESNLAPAFGVQKKERYGLTGLLVFRDCLEKLAAEYKNTPAPLILAPNPAVTDSAMESAVSLLASTTARFDKATLLVHVNDAPRFTAAYQFVDEFSILWDIADYPSFALEELSTILAATHCLSSERWRGFNICRHPLRPTPDQKDREALFRSTLAEFPNLAVAA